MATSKHRSRLMKCLSCFFECFKAHRLSTDLLPSTLIPQRHFRNKKWERRWGWWTPTKPLAFTKTFNLFQSQAIIPPMPEVVCLNPFRQKPTVVSLSDFRRVGHMSVVIKCFERVVSAHHVLPAPIFPPQIFATLSFLLQDARHRFMLRFYYFHSGDPGGDSVSSRHLDPHLPLD